MSNNRRICVCGRERKKGPVIISITTCKHNHPAKGGESICISAPQKVDKKSTTVPSGPPINKDDRRSSLKSSVSVPPSINQSGKSVRLSSTSSRRSKTVDSEKEEDNKAPKDENIASDPKGGGFVLSTPSPSKTIIHIVGENDRPEDIEDYSTILEPRKEILQSIYLPPHEDQQDTKTAPESEVIDIVPIILKRPSTSSKTFSKDIRLSVRITGEEEEEEAPKENEASVRTASLTLTEKEGDEEEPPKEDVARTASLTSSKKEVDKKEPPNKDEASMRTTLLTPTEKEGDVEEPPKEDEVLVGTASPTPSPSKISNASAVPEKSKSSEEHEEDPPKEDAASVRTASLTPREKEGVEEEPLKEDEAPMKTASSTPSPSASTVSQKSKQSEKDEEEHPKEDEASLTNGSLSSREKEENEEGPPRDDESPMKTASLNSSLTKISVRSASLTTTTPSKTSKASAVTEKPKSYEKDEKEHPKEDEASVRTGSLTPTEKEGDVEEPPKEDIAPVKTASPTPTQSKISEIADKSYPPDKDKEEPPKEDEVPVRTASPSPTPSKTSKEPNKTEEEPSIENGPSERTAKSSPTPSKPSRKSKDVEESPKEEVDVTEPSASPTKSASPLLLKSSEPSETSTLTPSKASKQPSVDNAQKETVEETAEVESEDPENINEVPIMMQREIAVNTIPFLQNLFRFRGGKKSVPNFDEEQKIENSDCTVEIFIFEKHTKECRRSKKRITQKESFYDGDSWIESVGRISFPTCTDKLQSNQSSKNDLKGSHFRTDSERNLSKYKGILKMLGTYLRNKEFYEHFNNKRNMAPFHLNLNKYITLGKADDEFISEKSSKSIVEELYVSKEVRKDKSVQFSERKRNIKTIKWYEGFLICFGLRNPKDVHDMEDLDDQLKRESSYLMTKYLRI